MEKKRDGRVMGERKREQFVEKVRVVSHAESAENSGRAVVYREFIYTKKEEKDLKDKRRTSRLAQEQEVEDEEDEESKVKELARQAVRGGGVPITLWTWLYIIGVIAIFFVYDVHKLVGKDIWRDVLIGTIGIVLVWMAPLKVIGATMTKLGALRENLVHIIPHLPGLLPYTFEILPHLLTLIDNIDKLGPLLDAMMAEKEYVLPLLPQILDKLEVILPHIDVIAPKIHVIAPYAHLLLPHIEVLLPHVDELAEHIDDLVVFLDVRGWEEVLPYIDKIAPYVPQIAPHSKRLVKHMDPLLPHIPILVKYLDNLAPQMDRTILVLDRLTPLLSLLPIADQTGILYSKLICKALPRVARILPQQSSSKAFENNTPASPMPSSFKAHKMKLNIPYVRVDAGTVFYYVWLNDAHFRPMRYSQLRDVHDALQKEISTYSKMKLLPFPDKTFLGVRLSDRGMERRRIALENYLERLAQQSDVLTEESPAFRKFIRCFYIS